MEVPDLTIRIDEMGACHIQGHEFAIGCIWPTQELNSEYSILDVLIMAEKDGFHAFPAGDMSEVLQVIQNQMPEGIDCIDVLQCVESEGEDVEYRIYRIVRGKHITNIPMYSFGTMPYVWQRNRAYALICPFN